MADNIKYVRWAAGVLKVIMVVNIIIGVISFIGPFILTGVAFTSGRALVAPINLAIDLGVLVSIVINAFITYTAARGLELLADIGYHLLRTWHQQVTPKI